MVLLAAAVACDAGDGKPSKDTSDKSGEEASNKDEKKKKKKKKDEAKDDGNDGDVAPAADNVTDKVADKEQPACGPLSSIPDIPDSRSNPPTLEEWGSACDVNTQGAGSHPGDCTMKIKREWLQVTCRGNMTGYEQFEGFGNIGQDYFEQHTPGAMASFVVRLRKGKSQKVRMCRGNERASLFVSWPPSSAKPTIVALGIGPKCDGSSWGAHH